MPYVTHTFPQGAHDVNKSSDTRVSPNISAAFARVASTRRPDVGAHRVERVTTARLVVTAHRVDVDAIVGVDICPSRDVTSDISGHDASAVRRARMNAWCIGARRRHGASGHDDDPDDADARSSAHAGGSTPKSAQDLNHARGHAGDAKSSAAASVNARELRHQRGTRRARVCLVVFCVFLIALTMTRPLYAKYIDVFEASAPSPPPAPPPAPPIAAPKRRSWARKFGLFG